MNSLKKLISGFIVLVFCICLLNFQVTAVSNAPIYRLSGDISGDIFTLRIYVRNTVASGGRLGLNFDNSRLTLLQGNNPMPENPVFTAVLQAGSDVSVATEQSTAAMLLSQERGHILIPWFTFNRDGINAMSEPHLIVTARFRLNYGVTELYANSVMLRDTSQDSIPHWGNGVTLYGRNGNVYRKNNLAFECDFPGANRVSDNASTVRIRANVPAYGRMILNGQKHSFSNEIELRLDNGDYFGFLDAYGFAREKISFTVSNNAHLDVIVELNSNEQAVLLDTEAIALGFAPGDYEDYVTRPITLPTIGERGSIITWESDNNEALTNIGLPIRWNDDRFATLTATVSKGDSVSTREFGPLRIVALAKLPPHVELPQPPLPPGTGTVGGGSSGATPPDGGASTNPDGNSIDIDFQDLDGVPWARDAILYLASRGIIMGTSNTTFSPQENVTRADYTVLLIRMLGYTDEFFENFDDIEVGRYYYEQIGISKKRGIAAGIGENLFAPQRNVLRQDMMTLTARAVANNYLPQLEMDVIPALRLFADYDQISDYARLPIVTLVMFQYITGADGRLEPLRNATRAETAVFLYRIYRDIR